LPEYVDLVVAASEPYPRVVLVAQSLGGFTAPVAAERLGVDELVLVNAMIPVPGETAGEWWAATGAIEARAAAALEGGYGEFDVETYFLHDVDVTGLDDGQHEESDAVFGSPCAFTSWPASTRVLVGADDRFFPAEFQARIAKARLGRAVDMRPGGHLIALSRPQLVADYLLGRGI
jgi:pimeloyl-ACP methyl ester carboxylesterase